MISDIDWYMLNQCLLYFHSFSIIGTIIYFINYLQKARDKFWSELRHPKLSPNFATPLSVRPVILKIVSKMTYHQKDYLRKSRERLWSELNDLQFLLKLNTPMSVIFSAVRSKEQWRSSRKICWIDFKDKRGLFKLANALSVTLPQLYLMLIILYLMKNFAWKSQHENIVKVLKISSCS